MSIASEFKAQGSVHGRTLLLPAEAAIAMIARAHELNVRVLGVDGFWVTERTTQPDLGHSVDLSEEERSWEAAAAFIAERASLGLMFEVVADEDTPDV